MRLLDVNALVALAWDSHIHHAITVTWFRDHAAAGWATCPITESGFVRVSANRHVLPAPISVEDAQLVLRALRAQPGHHWFADDVSIVDVDVPAIGGHRQVTDAHLLTLARRHGANLLTFDGALASLSGGADVEVLTGP